LKTRVLHLIGSFHQGGSERQAVALTRRLAEDSRYEIFVATLNKEGVLLDEISSLPIAEFPLRSFFRPSFVRHVRDLAKYLLKNRIDIVQTHDFYTNVSGMAAATLARTPVRIAAKRETASVRTKAQEMIESIAFGRSDVIVANAEAVRDYLVERRMGREKIEVIHNGVDTNRLEEVQNSGGLLRRFGSSDEKAAKVVTLVANLRHTVKNVPMFLRAAERVAAEVPNTHFVIAGEGELETELKEAAREIGLNGNVHFIGRCTDVPQLLRESYACVLTSNAEGFSNSILEYMAAGKPVVVTDVGGASEAVTADVGFRVRSDDDEAMANHLIDILNDEELAAQLGDAGKKKVAESFSADIQFKKTVELYDRLMKRKTL